ncbi:MAG: hypothetical protein JNJ45_04705 [Chthonomonas sp.]|nr:hypothetical protein [Chthonomonas sp.]
MTQLLQPSHIAEILPLWERFYPSRYHVTPECFHSHTFGSPVFDWGASQVLVEDGRVVAFATVKKPASPTLYAGGDPDRYHLQSIGFEKPMYGGLLLDEVIRTIRSRGARELVFGQDSLHFFPGCPTDCCELAGFLNLSNFEKIGETYDLEGDLSAYEYPAQYRPDDGAEYRRCSESDLGDVFDFFAQEFPLRWNYDIRAKIELEGPNTIFGLFYGGKCHGFALLQDHRDCHLPIGGAVWQSDLGAAWGSLGPIGVSKAVRGKKFGHGLLGNALLDLKARGVTRTIIDWTNLFDFYGPHGFTKARTYTTYSLVL